MAARKCSESTTSTSEAVPSASSTEAHKRFSPSSMPALRPPRSQAKAA